jgi:hypothetical protein
MSESGNINHRSLQWGLSRLALWGELDGEESADPHIRAEAAYSAKVTIDQLAHKVRSNQSTGGNTNE